MLLNLIRGGAEKYCPVILALLLLVTLGQPVVATEYSSNIYVKQSLFSAVYLLQDNNPATAAFALKSAHDMPVTSVFSVTPDVSWFGEMYSRIGITSTPISSVYVLLVNAAGNYSLQGSYALGTNTPAVHTISSATFYTAGTPPAPTSATLTLNGLTYPDYNGIVTTGISGVAAGYISTGTKYELYEIIGGSSGGTDGTLSATPVTTGTGLLSNYTIPTSANKYYRVRMAHVNQFTNNNENWVPSTNLLIPYNPPVRVSNLSITLGPALSNVALSWATDPPASSVDVYFSASPYSGFNTSVASAITTGSYSEIYADDRYYRVVPNNWLPIGGTFGGVPGTTPSETVGKKTFTLTKITPGYGINMVSLPYPSLKGLGGTTILNANELLLGINSQQAGADDQAAIKMFGYWNAATQQPVGFLYGAAGAPSGTPTLVHSGAPATPAAITLDPNQPYQINVDKTISFVLGVKL